MKELEEITIFSNKLESKKNQKIAALKEKVLSLENE